jgi:hypothetical protein
VFGQPQSLTFALEGTDAPPAWRWRPEWCAVAAESGVNAPNRCLIISCYFKCTLPRCYARQTPGFARQSSFAGRSNGALSGELPVIFLVTGNNRGRDGFAVDCFHHHAFQILRDFPATARKVAWNTTFFMPVFADRVSGPIDRAGLIPQSPAAKSCFLSFQRVTTETRFE